MSARTSLARAAAAAALVAAAAPAAAAAAPSLGVDRPCYSPGDVIDVSGRGYTPGGKVDLSFTGAGVGLNELQADLAGGIRAGFEVRERDIDVFLRPDESQREVLLAAVDRTPPADPATPADPASPPAAASTSFLLSRFDVAWSQDQDAFRPRRPLRLEVAGFTGSAGRTLHLHYVRDGRRLATVGLGRLRGPCGTLRTTLARGFPQRRMPAGRWRPTFNLSRTDTRSAPAVSWNVTVRKRDAG
jgi:hypothetical protein